MKIASIYRWLLLVGILPLTLYIGFIILTLLFDRYNGFAEYSYIILAGLPLLFFGVFLTIVLFKKTPMARTFLVAATLIAAVSLFCLLLYADGLAKFALGQGCSGFWGVGQSCLTSAHFSVSMVVWYVLYVPILSVLALIACIMQFAKQNKQRRKLSR